MGLLPASTTSLLPVLLRGLPTDSHAPYLLARLGVCKERAGSATSGVVIVVKGKLLQCQAAAL